MIAVRCFAGRKVALFGLGGSGLSTARALAAGGAEIAAWDDDTAARARAVDSGIGVVDLSAADWRDYAALVLAPGAPLTHPAPHWTAARAKAAGIEIIGDIELFCRERANRRRRSVHCDHRHQRQVDDDGADCTSPASGRPRRPAWRQYRRAYPRSPATGRTAHPCDRVLVFPDRPRAVDRSDDWRVDQSDARPSRPSWIDGELRGDQGAACRQRGNRAGRHRR